MSRLQFWLSLSSSRPKLCAALFAAAALTLFCTQVSYANPEGGVVSAGSAQITNPSPNTVQINQTSDKAVVNWQSYNVGQHEHVHYQQPDSQSITLNRINPASGVSKIYGSITANGQVWLMNPAGVWFGPGSYVNVAGLLATTAGISDADFMSGKYHFQQSPDWNGAVINEGMIVVLNHGLAALVAPGAVNNGQIIANLGTVVLGSSNEFTIDFAGDSLVTFAVGNDVKEFARDQNGEPLTHAVENSGTIVANGGKIQMAASVASKILDKAINMKGVAVADSVSVHNGEIIFSAGPGRVTVSGTVTASGKKAGEKGGVIKILGDEVALLGHAVIDASGHAGGGTILIGGNAHGAGTEHNASYSFVDANVNIHADAYANGDGGKVVVWANEATRFYGNIFARGGAERGNGGWVEVSGKQQLRFAGSVNADARVAGARAGTLLLDPDDLCISVGVPTACGGGAAIQDLTNPFEAIDGSNNYYVTKATLEALSAGTSPILLANHDIIFETSLNMLTGSGSTFSATASNAIAMGSFGITTAGGAVTLTSGAGGITNMGAIATGGGLLTLNSSGAITQTGVISGTGALNKLGSGTLTLSQTNSYSGGTSINGGTISVATLPSAAGNSTIGTGNLSIDNGGMLSYTGANVTFNRAITVGSGGGTIQSTSAVVRTLTLSGGISNSGALTFDTTGAAPTNITLATSALSGVGSVIKTGLGILTFGVANTYTGTTLVDAGTLRLTNLNGLGSGATQSSSTSVTSGATLNMNFATAILGNTNPITLNGTGVGGAGALIASSSTETLSNNIILASNATIGGANNMVLNGVISGGFDLTKVGAGTITLGGSNIYTGATFINVGTLTLNNANGLGSGGTQSSSTTVAATGAALNMNFATATLGNTNLITLNGTGVASAGALTGTTSTDTLSNDILLGSDTSVGGAGTMVLNGNISDGGGNYLLTKVGAGTITLNGVNTFGGGTTINTGTLSVTNMNGLGTVGVLAVNNAAILRLNLGGNTLQNTNTLTLSNTAALTGIVGAGLTDTLSNAITLAGTHTITSTTATAGLTLAGGITNGATNVTFTGSGNITVSAALGGGAGGIIKTGTGTLTLGAANTYTGATAVNAGVVSVTNADGLGGAGGGLISVATASTLRVNLGGATLANLNTITLTGTAALVGNSAAGITDIINNPITLAATGTKTITSTNATATLMLGGNITNNTALLSLNGAGDIVVNGVIGVDTGGLTKSGTGTLTLNAANSYTGATTISAGTVRIGVDNGIGVSSALNLSVSGAVFDMNGFDQNIGSLAGAAGTSVTLGVGTLTAGANNTTTTFSGVMSGSGSLIKTGTGAMSLAGANTYTGATNVSNGTLTIGNLNGLGSGVTQSSGVNVAAGATLNFSFTTATLANTNSITLNGNGVGGAGALTATTSTDTLTNAIILASDTTFGGASSIILNGSISDGGNNFGITKVGAGTVTLGGVNSYTGATLINAGTLTLNNANALGSGATQSSSTTVAATGAALNLNFATATLGNTNTISLNGSGISSAGALTGSASTDTVSNNITLTSNASIGGTGTMILNGVISDGGSNFSLTKAGTGTITLNGANTYGGGTTINTGTLSVTNMNGLGLTGLLAVNNAATLRLNLGGNILQNSSTLTLSNTAALTGVVGAGLTDTLNNAIVLAGTHTITSTTATAGLTLAGVITNGATNLTFTGSGNTTVSAALGGGAGGIIKTGTGTLTLGAVNTYTGATAVNAGTVSVTNADGLGGPGSGAISIATASTLRLNLSGATLANTSTITMTGTAALVGNSAAGITDTINNPIVLSATGTKTITSSNATATLILGGNITNNTALLSLNGAGDTVVNGVIGSDIGGLTKSGTGTLTLNAANTYTGITTINAGIVSVNTLADGGVASSIGAATNAAANLVLGGGRLQYTGSSVSIDRNYTLTAGTTNTIDVVNAATNLTITGASTATTGALTKLGSGTLTLAGANLYTGLTTVSEGTLAAGVNNALASGAVTVSGGIFDLATFSDTVGTVTLVNGSIDSSTGILTGSSYAVQNGTVSAILAGAGGLTKTTAGTVTLSGVNTYTGATTINAGILSVSSLANGGVASNIGASSNAAANLVLGGGTLQYTGGSVTTNRNFTLTAATTNTIDVVNALTNLSITGASTNTTGALTKIGSGTLTLGGANLYTGLTTVNAGTLAAGVNNALSSGAVTVNGGVYDISSFNDAVGALTLTSGTISGTTGILTATSFALADGTITARLAGSAALTKSTSGTVILSGANTYSGATVVNGGVLSIASAGGLGNTSGTTVASGATLDFNFNNATLTNTNAITLNGLGDGGNGALTMSGSNVTLNNPISLGSSALISGSGSGVLTLGGAITGTNTDFTINLNNAGISLPALTLTTSGNLSVAANGAISQTGIFTIPGASSFNASANSITLLQNNIFTGAVTLANSGANDVEINANSDLSLAASTVGRKLTATVNGTLTLAGALTANATGDSIVLSAARFDNSGNYTLNPGANGRYLIWSSNTNPFGGATPDVRGGLGYNFKQYNATFGVTAVLGSGNGFLYTLAPSVTPALTGTISKVYNANVVANLAGHYTSSGTVDGDSVTFDPQTGSYASANVGSGINVSVAGISIASATNGGATVYGYSLASTTANAFIGEITPAPLTATGITANNKAYDGNTQAILNFVSAALSGVYGGDNVSINTATYNANFITPNVGNNIPVVVSSLGLSGASSANYTLTQPTGITANITGEGPSPNPDNGNGAILDPQNILPNMYTNPTDYMSPLMQSVTSQNIFGMITGVLDLAYNQQATDGGCLKVSPFIKVCGY